MTKQAKQQLKKQPKSWYVYCIRTARGALYTGITTDTARRLKEHQCGRTGAKNLRGKGPLQMVFQQKVVDRSSAGILEARIKKLSKKQKEMLVAGALN